MTWMPIETAPKDGTYVLLWGGEWFYCEDWNGEAHPCKNVERGRYIDDEWHIAEVLGGSCILLGPTHWARLPDPPAMEDAA